MRTNAYLAGDRSSSGRFVTRPITWLDLGTTENGENRYEKREADMRMGKVYRFEKITFLFLIRVLEELLHVVAYAGDGDFRHDLVSSRDLTSRELW